VSAAAAAAADAPPHAHTASPFPLPKADVSAAEPRLSPGLVGLVVGGLEGGLGLTPTAPRPAHRQHRNFERRLSLRYSIPGVETEKNVERSLLARIAARWTSGLTRVLDKTSSGQSTFAAPAGFLQQSRCHRLGWIC